MRHAFLIGVWSGALLLIAARPSLAQLGAEGTVAGTGQVSVDGWPDTLRVQVELQARGPDMAKALAALKKRHGEAVAKLEILEAKKESIEFGEPHVSAAMTQQQKQMLQMLRQQKRSRGRSADRIKVPQVVLVSRSLTAEWEISAKSPDELLIAGHALTKKIREADLAGSKEVEEVSEEEAEMKEEMEEMMGRYGGQEEAKPGEPQFLYVLAISKEQHAKALTEAFQKARVQAAEIANAAGAQLGALERLMATDQSTPDANAYYRSGYQAYAWQAMMRSQQQRASRGETREAIGAEPGKVNYQVSVNAAFGLK